MSSINSIAVSGLLAAGRRLEVAASNVANVRSGLPSGAPGEVVEAFRALRADQVETSGGGTTVNVSRTRAPVDLANEMVEMMSAQQAFSANAKLVRIFGDMQKTLLDVKI
jgi:flagellar basal-body rod protein FlgC